MKRHTQSVTYYVKAVGKVFKDCTPYVVRVAHKQFLQSFHNYYELICIPNWFNNSTLYAPNFCFRVILLVPYLSFI